MSAIEDHLNRLKAAGLYILFDPETRTDWAQSLFKLAALGVPWFQLRTQSASWYTAEHLQQMRDAIGNATLIVNNIFPEDANDALDGIHIGQSDMPYDDARAILGRNRLVGVSARSKTTIQNTPQADYFGVGAVADTTTKDAPVIGLKGVRECVEATDLPIVAIGGLQPKDAPALKTMGIAAMAVHGAVWHDPQPNEAADRFLQTWAAT